MNSAPPGDSTPSRKGSAAAAAASPASSSSRLLLLVVSPVAQGRSDGPHSGPYNRTYLRPKTWQSRLCCGSVCSGVVVPPGPSHAFTALTPLPGAAAAAAAAASAAAAAPPGPPAAERKGGTGGGAGRQQ